MLQMCGNFYTHLNYNDCVRAEKSGHQAHRPEGGERPEKLLRLGAAHACDGAVGLFFVLDEFIICDAFRDTQSTVKDQGLGLTSWWGASEFNQTSASGETEDAAVMQAAEVVFC